MGMAERGCIAHAQIEEELIKGAGILLPVAEPMDSGAMALSAQPRDDARTEDARFSKPTPAIKDKQRLAAQA